MKEFRCGRGFFLVSFWLLQLIWGRLEFVIRTVRKCVFISKFLNYKDGFCCRPLRTRDSNSVPDAVLPGWARQLQGAEEFQKIQFVVWCRTLWGRREGWIIRSFSACLQAFFFLLSSNFYFQDFVLSSLHLLEFPQSYNPCYFQQNICISHFPLPLILSILKRILTWISWPKHVIVKWFIWIIAFLNYAEGYIERKIFNLCISSSKNVNIGICCKDWYIVEVQLVSALINVLLNLIDDWVLIS